MTSEQTNQTEAMLKLRHQNTRHQDAKVLKNIKNIKNFRKVREKIMEKNTELMELMTTFEGVKPKLSTREFANLRGYTSTRSFNSDSCLQGQDHRRA